MKGLSAAQLGLLALVALALLVSLVAVVVDAWMLAAVTVLIGFGAFVVVVVFTLAALTRRVGRLGETVREMAPQLGETASGIRRVDQRTDERFKTLDSSQARLQATERRMLAAFEAHRFHLEDDLADLRSDLAAHTDRADHTDQDHSGSHGSR